MSKIIGGLAYIKADGVSIAAKGDFTYNTGQNKREMVAGIDGVHGVKEMIQVPFIEGATSDISDVDLERIKNIQDATVELQNNNGKTFVLRNAYYTSEGEHSTAEGEVGLRFEGLTGEVIN